MGHLTVTDTLCAFVLGFAVMSMPSCIAARLPDPTPAKAVPTPYERIIQRPEHRTLGDIKTLDNAACGVSDGLITLCL